MASHQQTRIQAYLEKNKIGPLFEVRCALAGRLLRGGQRWGRGCPHNGRGPPRSPGERRGEDEFDTLLRQCRHPSPCPAARHHACALVSLLHAPPSAGAPRSPLVPAIPRMCPASSPRRGRAALCFARSRAGRQTGAPCALPPAGRVPGAAPAALPLRSGGRGTAARPRRPAAGSRAPTAHPPCAARGGGASEPPGLQGGSAEHRARHGPRASPRALPLFDRPAVRDRWVPPTGKHTLCTEPSERSLSCEKSVSVVFSEIFICSHTPCATDFPVSYNDVLAGICRCTDVHILLFRYISCEYLEFKRVLEQS